MVPLKRRDGHRATALSVSRSQLASTEKSAVVVERDHVSARGEAKLTGVAVDRRIDGDFVQHHLQVITDVNSPNDPDSRIGEEALDEVAYILIGVAIEFQRALMPDNLALFKKRLRFIDPRVAGVTRLLLPQTQKQRVETRGIVVNGLRMDSA